MKSITCILLRPAAAVSLASLTFGCSPPGAVNERNVVESTPHSTVSPTSETPEAYRKHMMERFKKQPGGKKIYSGKGASSRGPRRNSRRN
jgi:hypothetical protein